MSTQKTSSDGKNPLPGLDCPQCGFRIQMTIEMLLNSSSICCGNCSLELSIDKDKSGPALNSLKEAYNAVKKVENLKVQTKTGKQFK